MPPDFGPRRFSTDSVTSAMCKRSSAPFIERHCFHGMMSKKGGNPHGVMVVGFVLRNQRVGDGRLQQAEDVGEVQITNQAAAEDGSRTHSTFMDPRLYVAAADGAIHVLQQCANEKGDTPVLHLAAREGHLIVVENLIEAAKQLQETRREGIQQFVWYRW
ncbi:hypothetical protein CK203_098778 [Vitis vinifera]|uniref:Uncharacterized protein n=1 Tax=Vitis vinifera TaxID=29760 RepID=A0A438CUT1_VITVI|nr:hypothetical protein CK203_098778 [Vitis vinifera]